MTRRKSRAKRNSSGTKAREIVVTYSPDDGGWHVLVPEVAGCRTWGRSLGAARRNIREALSTCVDVFGRDADHVAQTATFIEYVALPAEAQRDLVAAILLHAAERFQQRPGAQPIHVMKRGKAAVTLVPTLGWDGMVETIEQTMDYPKIDWTAVIRSDVRDRLMQGKVESGKDVAVLRRFVKLNQPQFAGALGISVRTLCDWEQDRCKPEGPALALLRIAARHPRIIRAAAFDAAHAGQLVKLFLDDVRDPPDGSWLVARTAEEARQVLAGPVDAASLDHDLGVCSTCAPGKAVPGATPEAVCLKGCRCACHETGYDLVKWMAETGRWPRTKPVVHSANVVGAANMRGFIDRYWTPPSSEPGGPEGETEDLGRRQAAALAHMDALVEQNRQQGGAERAKERGGRTWTREDLYDRAICEGPPVEALDEVLRRRFAYRGPMFSYEDIKAMLLKKEQQERKARRVGPPGFDDEATPVPRGAEKHRNPRMGSTLRSFLEEEGIADKVDALAFLKIAAEDLGAEMAKRRVTKAQMAKRLGKSRARFDAIVDGQDLGLALMTFMRAAFVLGLWPEIRFRARGR